jgi:hypothetical protein
MKYPVFVAYTLEPVGADKYRIRSTPPTPWTNNDFLWSFDSAIRLIRQYEETDKCRVDHHVRCGIIRFLL